jgi:acyl carrier protein
MNKAELLKILNEVFVDIFNDDKIVVTEATHAEDIEDWDSLTNIQLVVAIEKRLKIKFKAGEIREWQNVGDLCNSILSKQHGGAEVA